MITFARCQVTSENKKKKKKLKLKEKAYVDYTGVCAATGLVYTYTEACADLSVPILQGSELHLMCLDNRSLCWSGRVYITGAEMHLDVSTQQRPMLHRDVSTLQRITPHLDVSGQ